MLNGAAQAQLPTTLDPGQVFMQIHACQQRNRSRVGDFAIEQRREAVSACDAIKEVVRWNIPVTGVPDRELAERALPKHLVVLALHLAEAGLVEGKGVR